ncbi:E3 ubiquitin-protein ligase XBAT33-like isoform X2 [Andrographis paniculata]|uniref:E3 ubiquitin-protein ligase XBAT33-like isoform X2 n=1 Tax=Andrographis paniculata TaxID=175694 RepID=UPI0021E91313|nr:E3 ubiquitin-protein ligase XBAT33-like isoform X2 [Andrographis paniculata]
MHRERQRDKRFGVGVRRGENSRQRMGNSFGCSASGERLVSAARDGDFVEAKMLLDCNPCLAKYSTFGGLNSPLHFAAAKGHDETALMHASRYGHWEVVQTLLLFRCNVTRADYLSGRTALHFAAINGHVRCMRLVVADFVPSVPYETQNNQAINDCSDGSNAKSNALSKFVNKAADGGVTALHMAALNGYFDCVHLLLDLQANVSAVTFHYGTSMDLIGAGSTPLHYAACGGNLKCCQILLARGANRLSLNCNGWLPLDVARMWGRHWLEPLLESHSDLPIPTFPPSNYLSLPLMSILNTARDCGLQFSASASDDADICAVCLERPCTVAAEGCEHKLCVRCALYLCSTSNVPSSSAALPGSIPCPFCRHGIVSFSKLPGSTAREIKLPLSSSLGLCTPCVLHHREQDTSETDCSKKKCVDSVSSDIFCPVSCSPFPSVTIPLCTCSEGPCLNFNSGESDPEESSPHRAQSMSGEQEKSEGMRLEKTTCSSMFWGRRSCSREHQCNAEINA